MSDHAPLTPDYHALFRALPDAFLLFSAAPDAIIIDNSDAHEAISGRRRAEVVGLPFFDAWPPLEEAQAEAELLRASHEHVRRHREPHRMPLIRYDIAGADGTYAESWWEATHYPVFGAAGELLYILQRTQNVTERVRAEQERAAVERALAEQRLETEFVLDTLPLIIWTSKADGQLASLNHGWYEFTGQPPTAYVASLNTIELIHPDDRAAVTSAWERSLATNSVCQFEYRLRNAAGDYRWMLARVAPRFDAAGHLAGWAGGATDIHTQRVLVGEMEAVAEEQLVLLEQTAFANREAQHQRDTFNNLFRQAPAMICILRGPEHRYEYVNPVYQSVFPDRQLTGRTVADALPEVVEQGIIELLDDVYRSGQSFHGNELPIAFDDGRDGRETRFFNFIYQQFREADGAVAGILVFAFEVTELVRARQRLELLAPPEAPLA